MGGRQLGNGARLPPRRPASRQCSPSPTLCDGSLRRISAATLGGRPKEGEHNSATWLREIQAQGYTAPTPRCASTYAPGAWGHDDQDDDGGAMTPPLRPRIDVASHPARRTGCSFVQLKTWAPRNVSTGRRSVRRARPSPPPNASSATSAGSPACAVTELDAWLS